MLIFFASASLPHLFHICSASRISSASIFSFTSLIPSMPTTISQDPDAESINIYFNDADTRGFKRRRLGPLTRSTRKTYEEAALTILPGIRHTEGVSVPASHRMEVSGRNPGPPGKNIELSQPTSPSKSKRWKKNRRPKQMARDEISPPPLPQGEGALALHSPAKKPDRSGRLPFDSPAKDNLYKKFQLLSVKSPKKVRLKSKRQQMGPNKN
jgi:hypothetical protein